jgi:hypothetical protein
MFEFILTNENVGRECEACEAPAELFRAADTLTIARERSVAAMKSHDGCVF